MSTILKFSYLKSQTLSAKIYSEDMTTVESTVAPSEKVVGGNPSGIYWLSFDTQLSIGNYCIAVENNDEEVILYDTVEWDGSDVYTDLQIIKSTTNRISFDSNDYIVSSLSSDGLDNISITEPTGVASTFREIIIQVWMRFFNKVTKNSTTITTYNSLGEINTTQSISEGSTDTVNKANSA